MKLIPNSVVRARIVLVVDLCMSYFLFLYLLFISLFLFFFGLFVFCDFHAWFAFFCYLFKSLYLLNSFGKLLKLFLSTTKNERI